MYMTEARPGPARLGSYRGVCVSEDKEGMETAGGPELHGPALVPALHRLLRRHGNHRQPPPSEQNRH